MPRYVDVEPIISNTIAMKSICTAIDLDGIVKRLEEAPTADVKPVVRGEWKTLSESAIYVPKIKCSACGFETFLELQTDYNFCPRCGAIMEGEKEND